MLWMLHAGAWPVLVAAGGALTGFAVGRRFGVVQGKRINQSVVPFVLRREAYQTGRCPVCDTSFFSDDTIRQKGVDGNGS